MAENQSTNTWTTDSHLLISSDFNNRAGLEEFTALQMYFCVFFFLFLFEPQPSFLREHLHICTSGQKRCSLNSYCNYKPRMLWSCCHSVVSCEAPTSARKSKTDPWPEPRRRTAHTNVCTGDANTCILVLTNTDSE